MVSVTLGKVDPSSFANSSEVIVKHLALFLNVNFTKKTLEGRVELSCERKSSENSILLLDSKDLTISNVTLLNNNASLTYGLSENFKTFGSALEIQIPKDFHEDQFVVSISYETSPSASGLQWLTPQQTLGKKEPYMFSQFQAIHARSVVPCQDTPSAKITYSAEISAPKELTVLMSGLHEGEPTPLGDDRRLFKFRQSVSIPSYLIAFAVGRIASKRLGPRSSVWAEPEILEAAAYEFAETEKMLDGAIKLGGDYVWGKYDILVMPPSFPFGGMENPCITFVTPTVLAGDRSLVDVISHEISHSWSGNLVTNSTFEHFWLNEGFTMFIERKIHGLLHGEKTRQFHARQGLEALKDAVENTLGVTSQFTKLVPSLTDVDPDDAFSTVPYEKGHTFLYYLEELVGGADVFNPFLKAYFNQFKHRSITTEDFKQFLLSFFNDKPDLKNVDWEAWLYGTGMPPVIPQYDTTLTEVCTNLAQEWTKGAVGRSEADIANMSSVQISLFLGTLLEEKPLSIDSIQRMASLYNLNESKNSEIRFRWIRLGLRAHAPEFIQKALDFVNEQGRMKFVRPLYREMYDWEESRATAIENYHKTKDTMMFVLSNQLTKDLHLA